MIVHPMKPVADENSRILILGSMPSVQSLEKQEYYGNPQNRFWPLMFQLFGRPFSPDYGDKISILKEHGVALWDSIASCERPGSLDKDIKNETPNDIEKLLRDFPKIHTVVFNGAKSFAVFKKHFGKRVDKRLVVMPSTSPIPRKTIRGFDDLYEHWKKINELIVEDC